MEFFTCLVTCGVGILFLYYLSNLWNTYNYWKVRGVVGPTPIPILGNYAPVIFRRQTEGFLLRKFYEQYPNETFIGVFKGVIPVLLIRDPDVIKLVLIKDVDHFHARCVDDMTKSYFTKSLFAMDGEKPYQNLRQALSPAFTKLRLTQLMPEMEKVLSKYIKFIDDLIEKKIEMEIRTLNSKYVLEMVGNLVIGVDLNIFSGNDDMEKLSKRLLNDHLYASLVHVVSICFPAIHKLFVPLLQKGCAMMVAIFQEFVTAVVNTRKNSGVSNMSFLHYATTLKEKESQDGTVPLVDDDTIVQQCLTYCMASYESGSNLMSFIMFELAHHQDIQNKCYEEVMRIDQKYSGKLDYEAVIDMKYLDMTLDETLRKYGLAHYIDRKCMSKYKFGNDLVIDKGTYVYVPINGLLNDEKYFPNPVEFNPERFSPENKHKIPQCAYTPFGEGRRICIGLRLGKFMIVLGLAAFLKRFKVVPSKKTPKELILDPRKILGISALHGVWVDIQRRC